MHEIPVASPVFVMSTVSFGLLSSGEFLQRETGWPTAPLQWIFPTGDGNPGPRNGVILHWPIFAESLVPWVFIYRLIAFREPTAPVIKGCRNALKIFT